MMTGLNSEQSLLAGTPGFGGTRLDFVRALVALGARIESRICTVATRRPRRIQLVCPYLDWYRIFGQAKIVADHRDGKGHLSFFAWEYQCTGGSVLCLGRLRRRLNDEWEVSLKAVYFS